MKKTVKPGKLSLHRETLRSLSDRELVKGKGGVGDPTLCSDPVSNCICSAAICPE